MLWFLLQIFSEPISILRRPEKDVVINIYLFSRTVSIILVRFIRTWIFSTYFRKILEYQILWKSVQWESSCSIRTGRRTDMTKLTVAFRNFAKAPKPAHNPWDYIIKCEERENQQDVTITCLLSTSVSNMFRASLCPSPGELRPCITAYGVLRWFCWMWLVAVVGRCVVGCEHTVQVGALGAPTCIRIPPYSSRTAPIHQYTPKQNNTPTYSCRLLRMNVITFETRWAIKNFHKVTSSWFSLFN